MSEDDEVKKVPDGVLAEAALKEKPAEVVAEPLLERRPIDTKAPTVLPVDPNYQEPTTLARFKDIANAISRDGDDAVRLRERGALIDFLLKRVEVLESAVLPFATSAMMMSNARMCLIADNRAEEPAGGTWLSNVQGIQLQPNEGLFFNACDAYGRARVNQYMMEVFEKLQAANALQAEKETHVEAGGTVH